MSYSKGRSKIWIDTDLSVGMKRHTRPGFCDVDDGYALWQLMNSPLDIVGISTVFGNTLIDNAYALAQEMVDNFAVYSIPVSKGAGQTLELSDIRSNSAVEELAQALREHKLTIMAIGPVTNVGILLQLYPELSHQIEEIVLVAGRRSPKDYFSIGNQGNRARDLNFDLDNAAFEIILQSGITTTLCPFEISNKVWITGSDLEILSRGKKASQWLAEHSKPWLQQWVDQGAQGFNPFDVLASHYLMAPEDIVYESLQARLEIHPDDTQELSNPKAFKRYLLCDRGMGYPVRYCYDVVPNYHEKLIQSLV